MTQALTVYYAISGTATNSTDYSGLGSGSTGSVTIAANQATATLTLTPVQDNAKEGNETVVLTLTTNSGYTIGSFSSATVTIADNPPVAGITANDASAAEQGPNNGQQEKQSRKRWQAGKGGRNRYSYIVRKNSRNRYRHYR